MPGAPETGPFRERPIFRLMLDPRAVWRWLRLALAALIDRRR